MFFIGNLVLLKIDKFLRFFSHLNKRKMNIYKHNGIYVPRMRMYILYTLKWQPFKGKRKIQRNMVILGIMVVIGQNRCPFLVYVML